VGDPGDRWRIKQFAAKVGVREATLRAWEGRYDLLRPERTDSGFRLYSRADELRVRSMQAHMARGLAPAQAAALAAAEAAVELVAPAAPAALIDALVTATKAFEATRFDQLLEGAIARGAVPAIGDVVLPLLVEIGRLWERAEITVGHEHFASHLIERRLLTLAAGWEAQNGPLALLACPSGERHTLGLICFGLLLADRGWRIAYLGADTPIDQVAAVSASLGPRAVILCALDPRHFAGIEGAISALGVHHHTILAGSAATADLARRLGVHLAAGAPAVSARALAERPPA
jgi:DNA-binding transcriptional MerR regulator/methylmalonyl-CoA mutase cobalamin-binding subunit